MLAFYGDHCQSSEDLLEINNGEYRFLATDRGAGLGPTLSLDATESLARFSFNPPWCGILCVAFSFSLCAAEFEYLFNSSCLIHYSFSVSIDL